MKKLFLLFTSLSFVFLFAAASPAVDAHPSILRAQFSLNHLDSLPADSCNIRISITADCDSSFCVKLVSPCRDTCLCMTVFFSNSTVASTTLSILGGSFVKLCFAKKIVDVMYTATTCPRCRLIKREVAPEVPPKDAKVIAIYPNPAKNTLTLAGIQDYSNLRLVITDMMGRSVMQQRVNASTVDISVLRSGTFIIELFRSGQKLSVQKIIK